MLQSQTDLGEHLRALVYSHALGSSNATSRNLSQEKEVEKSSKTAFKNVHRGTVHSTESQKQSKQGTD